MNLYLWSTQQDALHHLGRWWCLASWSLILCTHVTDDHIHWQTICHRVDCQVHPSGFAIRPKQEKEDLMWHCLHESSRKFMPALCGQTFSTDIVFFSIREHRPIYPNTSLGRPPLLKSREGKEDRRHFRGRLCRDTDHFRISALHLTCFSVATLPVPSVVEGSPLW